MGSVNLCPDFCLFMSKWFSMSALVDDECQQVATLRPTNEGPPTAVRCHQWYKIQETFMHQNVFHVLFWLEIHAGLPANWGRIRANLTGRRMLMINWEIMDLAFVIRRPINDEWRPLCKEPERYLILPLGHSGSIMPFGKYYTDFQGVYAFKESTLPLEPCDNQNMYPCVSCLPTRNLFAPRVATWLFSLLSLCTSFWVLGIHRAWHEKRTNMIPSSKQRCSRRYSSRKPSSRMPRSFIKFCKLTLGSLMGSFARRREGPTV